MTDQRTSAPPQTPAAAAAAQSTALTTAQQNTGVEVAQDVRVLDIAGRDGVERFETIVTIPADYQYAIPMKGIKDAQGNWDNTKNKVGLLSDAYDYLNRVVGVTFFLPETVHDQTGVIQPNPIHRRDYILLRMGGVWYNPMGQLIMGIEDIEVDFGAIYMDKRANAKSARPKLDGNGQPVWDEAGNPVIALSEEDNAKVIRELTRLRAFGLRYPYTVARTRLMKLATGIRSLPIDQPTAFKLKVVGFRDKMTPQDRIAQVTDDATELFGASPNISPLNSEELVEAEPSIIEPEDAAEAIIVEPESTRNEPAAAAPIGTAICGWPTGTHEGKQEVCLVILDGEGKHVGPHRSPNFVVPQEA